MRLTGISRIGFDLGSFGFWTLIGIAIWPALSVLGPKIEGNLDPVLGNARLIKVQDNGDGTSTVWGTVTKLRDCQFISLEWYFGNQVKFAAVKTSIEDRAAVRDPGPFTFGPVRVALPAEELKTQSFATVKHSCHPLWLTETHFWP